MDAIVVFNMNGNITGVYVDTKLDDLAQARGWRAEFGRDGDGGTFHGSAGYSPKASFIIAHVRGLRAAPAPDSPDTLRQSPVAPR